MATAVATQRRNLLLAVTKESTTGRTYIVTGANSGLGFEAAKHLVSLGASKVILAVRNIASGLEAKTAIETSTKTTNIAEVWELDLASYDSVKKFAKKAEEGLERIDALIENAGVAGNQQGFVEGHLLNVTVNVLSTLLLGVLLLPKMSEGAKKYGIVPHVVFVTSSTAFDMRGSWEGMKDNPIKKIDKVENLMMTYPLSKLLEVLAVRELAKLVPVQRTGVVINLVCPGLCVTNLARNAPQAFKDQLKERQVQYGRTAEDGSRTLLFGAVAGKNSHGCFTDSCEIAEDKVPSWITDEEGQKSQKILWNAVVSELEAAVPGCVEKLSQV